MKLDLKKTKEICAAAKDWECCAFFDFYRDALPLYVEALEEAIDIIQGNIKTTEDEMELKRFKIQWGIE